MYRIYKNILHSFPGDVKILVYFKRILWLISWNLQDDQGGITCMPNGSRLLRADILKEPILWHYPVSTLGVVRWCDGAG